MTSTSTQKAPKGTFRADPGSASRASVARGNPKKSYTGGGEKMLGMRPSNRTHEQPSTFTLNTEVEVARHERNARIFEASASAWARTVEAMSAAFARIVEAVAAAPWGWLLLITLWERFR